MMLSSKPTKDETFNAIVEKYNLPFQLKDFFFPIGRQNKNTIKLLSYISALRLSYYLNYMTLNQPDDKEEALQIINLINFYKGLSDEKFADKFYKEVIDQSFVTQESVIVFSEYDFIPTLTVKSDDEIAQLYNSIENGNELKSLYQSHRNNLKEEGKLIIKFLKKHFSEIV